MIDSNSANTSHFFKVILLGLMVWALLILLYLKTDFGKRIITPTTLIKPEITVQYEYHFQKGMQHLEVKEYALAVDEFKSAVRLRHDDKQGFYYLAKALLELGDNQEAAYNLEQALALDDEYKDALYLRGLVASKEGEFDIAVRHLSRFIHLDKTTYEAFAYRANAFKELGKYERAILDYTIYLNAGNKDTSIYINRGEAYYLSGNLADALTDLEKADAFGLKEEMLFKLLAEISSKQGYNNNAVKYYGELIKLEPNNSKYYFRRAGLYENLNMLSKAIKDYGVVIRMEKNNAIAYIRRGKLFLKKNKHRSALADFDQAYQITPYDDAILKLRTTVDPELRKYQSTIDDLTSYLAQYPKDAQSHDLYAKLRATAKDKAFHDASLAIYHAEKACVLTDWQNPDYLETLAAAYARGKHFDDAIKWQKKAIKLGSQNRKQLAKRQQRLKLYKNKQAYTEKR